MDNSIKRIIELLKHELESNIPHIKSEISELTKPSMMGESGISYIFDTDIAGVGILFWDTGIFEISTDLIKVNRDDNVFFSYNPDKIKEKYPKVSKDLFLDKINQLLKLLGSKYSGIKSNISL